MNGADPAEEAIFNVARLFRDSEKLGAYLDLACDGKPQLRRRIERLLGVAPDADEFFKRHSAPLGQVIAPLEAGAIVGNSISEGPGTMIGRYKLLEKIGEGGCGVVYMAEQEEPVRRRVALKIIKLGMDTKSVIARFEAERQALAMMDHPNIAKIYDAGSTEAPVAAGILRAVAPGFQPGGIGLAASDAPERADPGPGGKMPPSMAGRVPAATLSAGRPYIVMELVRGIKITDYCDQNNLTTPQRLNLFIQVSQAVQHAHQKGIIHRDLKPSNILVTVNDGVAVPKVIDFGIAKATGEQRLTDKTVFTAFEQFMGTPAYMSPEQAAMTSLDIDTRSDIYSLGVLLYELLTGKTPFDTQELMKAGLDEMRRTIREVEPVKPSKVVERESELRVERARARGVSGSTLNSQLKLLSTELDWIVMKCLEKDRARRYETANGLASDIQRHLSNEPVVACPPSNLYKFQKLVRRNKLAFAAGAGVAASLVIGLAVALWQSFEKTRAYNRAVAAEQEAKTEARTSRQVAQFLEDMLEGVGPEIAKGRDATLLKEILNKTAQRLEAELGDQPKIEAYLRERLGKVYGALGDYPAAELMHRRVLELRRRLYPHGHRDLAEALNNLAITTMLRGRLPEAEGLSRDALAMGRRFPSPYPGDMAAWLSNLGLILRHQGKSAEAEELYREALALNRKTFGNEHREVAVTLNNLAGALYQQDKFDESEPLLREAIELSRKLFGNEHPIAANALTSLTLLLANQGRLQEAESVGREAVAMQKSLLDGEHPNVANALGNLAEALKRQGNLAEAESLEREALAIRRKKLGDPHPILARSLHNLGIVLNSRGKRIEAEATLREALAVANKFPGNNYANPTNILAELNKALIAQGKPPLPPTAPADNK